MALGETAAALIGAGIGAGGAVLAQVAASVFSGRRDTERLAWDQAKQEREERLRREERFLDLKRELYARYITMTNQMWDCVSTKPRDESKLPDLLDFQRIQTDIELIAPGEVSRKTQEARLMLLSAYHSTKAVAYSLGDAVFSQTLEAVARARSAMQADLRGG